MSVRSNRSFLLFTFSISLLIFCPVVLIDLYKSQFLICKMMRTVPTSQVDISVKNATPHKVLIRLTWSNCSLMSATTINPQESMWRLEYIHHHVSNINAICLAKRPKGIISCIGEGNGNPLQCSSLENPRDGGARWAAVYRVAQSRTRLTRLSSSCSSSSSSKRGIWLILFVFVIPLSAGSLATSTCSHKPVKKSLALT